MDGLRQQPEMSHHGNAHFHQPPHGTGDGASALELDRRRPAFLEKPSGVAHGIVRAGLIREEGHVGDDQRALSAPHDGGGVVDHDVERHGERAVVSKHRHADRIAHQ